MCPISATHKENIISLASHGHPTYYIASHTGISQPTVSRVLKDILPNWQTPHSDHPSKLFATATCSILLQITTGKAANAVQVTRHINTIIPNPVPIQTVRNALMKHSFKAVTKKKKHCSPQCTGRNDWPLLWSIRSWQWRTGREWLGQMGSSGCGNRWERGWLRARYKE